MGKKKKKRQSSFSKNIAKSFKETKRWTKDPFIKLKNIKSVSKELDNLEMYMKEGKIERVVNNAGVVEKFGDFIYHDGGQVPVGEPYHIHYSSEGKTEIYMSGKKYDVTSQLIHRKRGYTTFGEYVNIIEPNKAMTYLNSYKFEVTKKQRKIGVAYRFFAKQFNDVVSPIFEIKKGDFAKHTPFYKKIKAKWSLDINRDMMMRKNIEEINRIVSEGFNSLEFSLNPVEGHIDGDISLKEKTSNKFKKLIPKNKKFKFGKGKKKKKNFMNKGRKTFSTSTSTSAGSLPDGEGSSGGGGAY
jgi:uncharacterized membrane protein YgcG|tara:strand:+ start:6993 stop:7889 length:897 start_codon:yes stop_codon:yes gene_type:complete